MYSVFGWLLLIILFIVISERADSTGATGDRLKEGAAINQSLSSLGNVIAGQSKNYSSSFSIFPGEGGIPGKKDKMPVVPYWVLKSSFGTSKGVLTSKAPQRCFCGTF